MFPAIFVSKPPSRDLSHNISVEKRSKDCWFCRCIPVKFSPLKHRNMLITTITEQMSKGYLRKFHFQANKVGLRICNYSIHHWSHDLLCFRWLFKPHLQRNSSGFWDNYLYYFILPLHVDIVIKFCIIIKINSYSRHCNAHTPWVLEHSHCQ